MYGKATKLGIAKANGAALSKSMSRRMVQHIKISSRRFVETAGEKIPVWTGEAQSSLLPLASAVRAKQHVHTKPDLVEWSNPPDTPNWGDGDYELPATNARRNFRFSFTTNVPHFAELDVNDVSGQRKYQKADGSYNLRNETPWNALSAAMNSFRDEMLYRLSRHQTIQVSTKGGRLEFVSPEDRGLPY